MLGFLFVDDDDFRVDPADVGQAPRRRPAARSSRPPYDALSAVGGLGHGVDRGGAARQAVEDLGLKPRNAFGPVRVAITGRRISPPLFESMELLGREESLRRLQDLP